MRTHNYLSLNQRDYFFVKVCHLFCKLQKNTKNSMEKGNSDVLNFFFIESFEENYSKCYSIILSLRSEYFFLIYADCSPSISATVKYLNVIGNFKMIDFPLNNIFYFLKKRISLKMVSWFSSRQYSMNDFQTVPKKNSLHTQDASYYFDINMSTKYRVY